MKKSRHPLTDIAVNAIVTHLISNGHTWYIDEIIDTSYSSQRDEVTIKFRLDKPIVYMVNPDREGISEPPELDKRDTITIDGHTWYIDEIIDTSYSSQRDEVTIKFRLDRAISILLSTREGISQPPDLDERDVVIITVATERISNND